MSTQTKYQVTSHRHCKRQWFMLAIRLLIMNLRLILRWPPLPFKRQNSSTGSPLCQITHHTARNATTKRCQHLIKTSRRILAHLYKALQFLKDYKWLHTQICLYLIVHAAKTYQRTRLTMSRYWNYITPTTSVRPVPSTCNVSVSGMTWYRPYMKNWKIIFLMKI